MFEGSEVLSVDSDDSSGEFDHSLLIGQFARENSELKRSIDEQVGKERSRQEKIADNMLGKRSIFPGQQEIQQQLNKRLMTQERVSRSNKATPFKEAPSNKSKQQQSSVSEKHFEEPEMSGSCNGDSIFDKNSIPKIEDVEYLAENHSFPLKEQIRATDEDIQQFQSREPSLSPNKLVYTQMSQKKAKATGINVAYSSDQDENFLTEGRGKINQKPKKILEEQTKPSQQRYSKESETIQMEETPRKEINRVSIDDLSSLPDIDCYSQIIKHINHVQRVKERQLKDVNQQEFSPMEIETILSSIQGFLECAIKSRKIRDFNNLFKFRG